MEGMGIQLGNDSELSNAWEATNTWEATNSVASIPPTTFTDDMTAFAVEYAFEQFVQMHGLFPIWQPPADGRQMTERERYNGVLGSILHQRRQRQYDELARWIKDGLAIRYYGMEGHNLPIAALQVIYEQPGLPGIISAPKESLDQELSVWASAYLDLVKADNGLQYGDKPHKPHACQHIRFTKYGLDEEYPTYVLKHDFTNPEPYVGHCGGDFLFRYFAAHNKAQTDPQRFQYQGQIPRPEAVYMMRLREIVPHVLGAITTLLAFDPANPARLPDMLNPAYFEREFNGVGDWLVTPSPGFWELIGKVHERWDARFPAVVRRETLGSSTREEYFKVRTPGIFALKMRQLSIAREFAWLVDQALSEQKKQFFLQHRLWKRMVVMMEEASQMSFSDLARLHAADCEEEACTLLFGPVVGRNENDTRPHLQIRDESQRDMTGYKLLIYQTPAGGKGNDPIEQNRRICPNALLDPLVGLNTEFDVTTTFGLWFPVCATEFRNNVLKAKDNQEVAFAGQIALQGLQEQQQNPSSVLQEQPQQEGE